MSMKTLKVIGLVLLIAMSVISFIYLNYSPESIMVSDVTSKSSELTDLKISKFIRESMKKVSFTIR